MSDTNELARRRRILSQHLGEQLTIKRQAIPRQSRQHVETTTCTLLVVNRSRAVVLFGEPVRRVQDRFFGTITLIPKRDDWKFGESGEWAVPIGDRLLPGSVEPAPGQLELFT